MIKLEISLFIIAVILMISGVAGISIMQEKEKQKAIQEEALKHHAGQVVKDEKTGKECFKWNDEITSKIAKQK